MNTDYPSHLLATSLYGNDELLFVFEGVENSTFNYILSTESVITPISSNPLVALSATYPYDDIFDLKPVYHSSPDTGFYGIENPLLTNIKDVKIINNSLFFLTSAVSLGGVIEDELEDVDVTDMVVYSSILSDTSGTYFSTDGDYVIGNEIDYADRDMLRFDKISGSSYNIIAANGKYWTTELLTPWNVTLEDKIETDTDLQQSFTITFSIPYPNKVTIKTMVAAALASGSNGLLTMDFITGQAKFDVNYSVLYTLNEFSAFERGYSPDSAYVTYHNSIGSPANNRGLVHNDVIRNTTQNLLVDTPFKTAIDKTAGTIDVNIANLKNIQTPEYEYATAPYFVGDTITQPNSSNTVDAIKRREYDQLFMGSNQERGYENPCLGFTANTKELTFASDKILYFHYPKTAPTGIPIQSIGFIESGAVPSNTPARSDKIWKKLANYEEDVWWGNTTYSAVTPTSSVSLPLQQGTWLCSWLSASDVEGTQGAWMDRWYYPGFATVIDALTYNTDFDENMGDKVFDEPSQMTMDGGCWYKYFHFGPDENQRIVTALSNDGLTALRVEYDTWDSKTIDDKSIYENDSVVSNFSSNVVSNGTLDLNGDNQYGLTPYSSSYKLSDKITVSSRMKFDDWENISGHHIISNGVNNGWNIKSTNGYFTPSLVIFEKTYGHLLFLNNDGTMYYDSLYPVSGSSYGDPTSLAIDGDLTIWATNNDANTKRLYKASYDGFITSEIEFDASTNLTEVSIDQNKNAWVLDTTTNTASGFAPDLSLIGTVVMPSPSAVSRIDFDTQNVFLSGDATILDRCIDSSNNVFELRDGADNIYKNTTEVYSASGVTNIACDSGGILWALKDGNVVVKTVAGSTSADITCTIGDYTTGQRRIVFTNEYSSSGHKDYAWILHSADNRMYKVDDTCTLVEEFNLSDYVDVLDSKFLGQDRSLMVFDINGDSTGHRWQTKYLGHTPRVEAQVVLDQYLLSGVTLSYPASNFVSDEFNNISFTYDSVTSIADLYINTVLVDSASSTPNTEIYYKQDNAMIIGGDMANDNSLNDALLTNRYSVIGEIDRVRIYDTALNSFDIKHLEFLDYNFADMTWNMPVGTQSFVEEVSQFFKNKLPGAKSHFYNIRLSHLGITDANTRAIIEEIIRETVVKVAPVHTELYNIIWD
jgi:hypothetical protein